MSTESSGKNCRSEGRNSVATHKKVLYIYHQNQIEVELSISNMKANISDLRKIEARY